MPFTLVQRYIAFFAEIAVKMSLSNLSVQWETGLGWPGWAISNQIPRHILSRTLDIRIAQLFGSVVVAERYFANSVSVDSK